MRRWCWGDRKHASGHGRDSPLDSPVIYTRNCTLIAGEAPEFIRVKSTWRQLAFFPSHILLDQSVVSVGCSVPPGAVCVWREEKTTQIPIVPSRRSLVTLWRVQSDASTITEELRTTQAVLDVTGAHCDHSA